MIYHIHSERPEIKLSEVSLKKILTDADINFKFLVLKNQDAKHVSEIECINLQSNIYIYTNEDMLTLTGEKSAMVKIVSLIKEYYGSLSDFKLSNENKEKTIEIVGNTSAKEIDEAF